MRFHVFPTEEALQLALASRLVPPEVQAAPARFSRAPDGAIAVKPARPLSREVLRALERAGVRPERAPAESSEVRCWPEILPARPTSALPDPLGPVVFAFPRAEGHLDSARRPFRPSEVEAQPASAERSRTARDRPPEAEPKCVPLLELCGELLRLGCDRQEVLLLEGGPVSALLRVIEPPYFTFARALERTGGVRAFIPAAEGVWVETGYSHPFASVVRPPEGVIVLIPGEGPWWTVEDGPWTDSQRLVELALPGPPIALRSVDSPPRLRVPLRLVPSRRSEPPSLWILRMEPVRALEELAETWPEAVVSRLAFAIVTAPGEAPIAVVRARPSREGPPALTLGEPYAPILEIPNLFVPIDRRIEPPLRRDRLRSLLADDPERLSWLTALGSGAEEGFRVESVPDAAFVPLAESIDYVLDVAVPVLEPWVRSTTFDLEPFEVVEERTRPRRKAPKPAAERPPEPPAPARPQASSAPPSEASSTRTPDQVPASDAERELNELEQAFFQLPAAADSPERHGLWRRMGALHGQLGHSREAALCWSRALWEAEGDDARSVARAWVGAARLKAQEILSRPEAGVDEARALASQIALAAVASGEGLPGAIDLHAVQRWLDAHDEALDVRSLWLARAGLARLVGGDALALAQARDRVLHRLGQGLSLERDVPRFLRFGIPGQRGEGSLAAARLGTQLEGLLERFEGTSRKRSAVEAPLPLTRAYVRLVFAYGFARLGQVDRARALREPGDVLDRGDPVHRYLVRAYQVRIDQALEGHPPGAAWPPELADELASLEGLARYKVDRLRQSSAVLEPQERLDAVDAFLRRSTSGPDAFARVRQASGPVELGTELEAVLGLARGATAAERGRLVHGAIDYLPLLPGAEALPLLDRMLASCEDLVPAQRAGLLGEALRVAGHFDDGVRVRAWSAALEEQLAIIDDGSAAEVARGLGSGLRSLRRLGFRDEAAALLEAAAAIRGDGPAFLMARLAVAGGFAALQRLDAATPILEEAFARLAQEKGPISERLAIARATCSALACAPLDVALPGLWRVGEQLPSITDSFNTNSHYCLSLIDFADALVMGHSSEELAVPEAARRFVEADEYLVRRRIHREIHHQGGRAEMEPV